MPRQDYRSQTVAVTGASSGIGVAFAHALATRGADLVLVARRKDRLDHLAAELHDRHGITATPIPIDLADPDAADTLRAALTRDGITLTSVVNNAGFTTFGNFTDADPERIIQEIAVDVLAPVRLSHTFLPDVVAAQGFLINVASMVAYAPAPRMAVYGAAKAFVLSFTEALWAETRHTGATVFALSPGATSTEFNAVVGTQDATAGAAMRTAEQVVTSALTHLERHRPGPSTVDGAANRLSATLIRALSRRLTATTMHRITDPARRSGPRGAGAPRDGAPADRYA